jgi:hypothetical protein
MSDDTKDSPEKMGRLMGKVIAQSMSVEDAIRFKHSLNQDIKYGGKNAKQIKAMQDMNSDSRKQLEHDLAYTHKSWSLFPEWFWVAGLLVGGGCVLYSSQPYVLFGGFAVICYCAAQLAYRVGHNSGYIDGFQSGHKNGVNTAFGVTPEDDEEIQKTAIEMELDEGLIKTWDERKSD